MNSKYIEVCDRLGWDVREYDDGTAGIFQGSPAGEDFFFEVSSDNFVQEVQEYAADFDVDEHVEMWIEARRNGVAGVPSTIRELVEDAEAIDEMLQNLANALERAERKDRYTGSKGTEIADRCIEVCENFGWTVVRDNESISVSLVIDLPIGKKFSFGVWKDNFVQDVRTFAECFDVDDYVIQRIDLLGEDGFPSSARELVEDAESIDKMLQELAAALEEVEDEYEA